MKSFDVSTTFARSGYEEMIDATSLGLENENFQEVLEAEGQKKRKII